MSETVNDRRIYVENLPEIVVVHPNTIIKNYGQCPLVDNGIISGLRENYIIRGNRAW